MYESIGAPTVYSHRFAAFDLIHAVAYAHAVGAPTVLVHVRDGGITKAILKGMQLPLVQYYYCTVLVCTPFDQKITKLCCADDTVQ